MTIETIFLLSSGLFLGWSLGANDAGNVFGTAVGSRMIRFSTAILVCSIFMVLGAVWSGEGVSRGLVELGSVNVLGGAFMVALAAALAVFLILRTGIQVSTTQALIGSLAGLECFCRGFDGSSYFSQGCFNLDTWAVAGSWICDGNDVACQTDPAKQPDWPGALGCLHTLGSTWLWSLGCLQPWSEQHRQCGRGLSAITTLPSSQLAGL